MKHNMTTTSHPMQYEQTACTITDQQAHTHALELNKTTLLVNGCPATIRIAGEDLHLATETATIVVSAQAFWHAFANAEPTAREAGLLLADSLVRSHALHQVRAQYQHIAAHIETLSTIPLPSYHLSPIIEQTLAVYDGTPQTTHLLARILKQDEGTIERWALLLGKQTQAPRLSEDERAFKEAEQQQDAEACTTETRGEKSSSKRFRWTTEQEKQLTDAFCASTASSVTATIQEIAQQFGWPTHAVQYKSYELGLPQRKQQQQAHQREGHQQAQEDHSSTASPSPEIHQPEHGATNAIESETSAGQF